MQRVDVRAVGVGKFAHVREKRTKRDPLSPISRPRRAFTPRREHGGKVRPGGLVDGEPQAVGGIRRRPARGCLQKPFPRLREPMQGACDLCANERGACGIRLDASKLAHEHFEPIERAEVAQELRRELFLLDDELGNAGLLGRAPEPVPGAQARALEIDGGDVAGRRDHALECKARDVHHLLQPNRFFRLSRPAFCNVATMVLMMRVGWPSERYWTRHVIELPPALGATSRIPV